MSENTWLRRGSLVAGLALALSGCGPRSVTELQPVAQAGDAQAQIELGMRYATGNDVPRDPAQAAQWFRAAAVQGDNEGRYRYGVALLRGDGVPLDEPAAFALLHQAGELVAAARAVRLVDIAAVAQLAKARGALVGVDNTFASPVLQNPLNLGADIVLHSCTKYIGGHSDVIGGALIVSDDELAQRLRYVQNAVGAILAPWDCFLLLRSTKTLHVRVERHCANAAKIADFLAQQTQVERVLYPGRADHPQHEIAKRQMRGFGGMITMTLKGGLPAARAFLERVSVFSLAESLGGVESLIEHPAIMTHASIDAPIRQALGIGDGLVRLSVGIEDVEDLIADLAEALAGIG